MVEELFCGHFSGVVLAGDSFHETGDLLERREARSIVELFRDVYNEGQFEGVEDQVGVMLGGHCFSFR